MAGSFDCVGVDFQRVKKVTNMLYVVFVDYLTKCPDVFTTKDQM